MNKERLDEIIENINKHNILQSVCGGMSSYDCAISELAEYTLNLKQALNEIREYCNNYKYEYVDIDHSGVGCEVDGLKILQIIDKVLGGSDE